MEGKKILEQVEHLEKDREEKEKKKREKEKVKKNTMARFYRCQNKCHCGKSKCEASGLKMCGKCSSILRSRCGKKGCIVDGMKPEMQLPKCDQKVLNVREVYDSPSNSLSSDDDIDLNISIDILASSTDDDVDDDADKNDDYKKVQNLKPTSLKRGAEFRNMVRNLDAEFSSGNDS